jgi:hypothetical protein
MARAVASFADLASAAPRARFGGRRERRPLSACRLAPHRPQAVGVAALEHLGEQRLPSPSPS